jgi:cytoskeletal protein CcmA (bactofilin family)
MFPQGELSVLEVKRKPNDSRSTRNANAASAISDYQAMRAETQSSRTTDNVTDSLTAPSEARVPVLVPIPKDDKNYQTRIPVITGEANYKGTLPIDGVLVGQLGAHGGNLAVRQRSGSAFSSQPELSGEISFRDALRVNGHIAGTVYSKSGTLFVDVSATIDGNVEVGIAIISGTVRGDVVAHQRVELGPSSRIYGNIWTRSLAIKDGAIFDGVCTMIGE